MFTKRAAAVPPASTPVAEPTAAAASTGGFSLEGSLAEWFHATFTNDATSEAGVHTLATSAETSSEVATGDGETAVQTQVETASTSLDTSTGNLSQTTGSATKVGRVLDASQQREVAATQLAAHAKDLDGFIAQDRVALAEIDAKLAALDPELTRDEADALRKQYKADQDQLRKQIAVSTKLKTDIAKDVEELKAGKGDLGRIVGEHEIDFSEAASGQERVSHTIAMGLDGVAVATEQEAADGATRNEAIAAGPDGITSTSTTTTAEGDKTTESTGLDLSEGVGLTRATGTESEDGASSEQASSGRLVADDDGNLTGVAGTRSSSATDADGNGTSRELRGTLTTDTVGAGGTIGRSTSSGDEKTGQSFGKTIGVDGSIHGTAEPLPDGRVKVVITITGTIAASATAERHAETELGGAQAGVTGGLSGTASASVTRVFSHAEAEEYFGKLDRGEAGEYPELALAGKLAAGADVLANLATELQDGEGYDASFEIAANACVSAGWGAIAGKLTVGGSGKATFGLVMEGDKARYQRSLVATVEVGADGTLTTVDAVSLTAGGAQTHTIGVSVSGLVDLATPAGTAQLRAIMTAVDVDALEAAATAAHGTISESRGDTATTQAGVALGPIAMGGTHTSGGSETLGTGPDGNTAEVIGFNGDSTDVTLREQTAAKSGSTDTATAKVDGDGIETDLASERVETTAGTGSIDAAGILASGLPAALASALVGEERRLATYHISKQDMAIVVGRAGGSDWNLCFTGSNPVPWQTLGNALAHPVPASEFADNPDEANWLSQARAIGTLFRSDGGDWFACWDNVLRRFEGSDRTHTPTTQALGVRMDWPTALAKQATQWEAAEAHIAELPTELAAESARDQEDSTQGDATCRGLLAQLDAIAFAILGSDAFASVAVRSEMASRVNAAMAEVRDAWADYRDSLECENAPDLFAGAPTSSSDDDPDLGSEGQLQERIQLELSVLRSNKLAEDAILAAIPGASFEAVVGEHIVEVKRLWDVWARQITTVRALYLELDLPEGQWQVSAGPNLPRRELYEPDCLRISTALVARNDARDNSVQSYVDLRYYLAGF
ncbi:MAG: hypothetical protein ABI867_17455 [Kofleriaceae bacterium]